MDDSARLHLVVTESADNFAPNDEDVSLLRGALLISEWVTPDGQRKLTWVSTDAQGTELETWDVRGFTAELVASLDYAGDYVDGDDDVAD